MFVCDACGQPIWRAHVDCEYCKAAKRFWFWLLLLLMIGLLIYVLIAKWQGIPVGGEKFTPPKMLKEGVMNHAPTILKTAALFV